MLHAPFGGQVSQTKHVRRAAEMLENGKVDVGFAFLLRKLCVALKKADFEAAYA
jgi:hypothetical protein